jgi:glycosyltransferase involved in cell wall biosynthesis
VSLSLEPGSSNHIHDNCLSKRQLYRIDARTMSQAKVSVVIPSYQRSFDLSRCLAAIKEQSRAADEILIIAREGDMETREVVSEFELRMTTVRMIHVNGPGLVAALNCGLANARGDFLVFTDDDSEPQADWLQRIEESFSNPQVGAVGGRDWLQLPSEPSLFSPPHVDRVGILSWYGAMYGNHHCPVKSHTRNVMFLKGVNMAFRRSALGSYQIDKLLRGSGAQVGTEIDLCMRARDAGFKVLFDDRILVKHFSASRQAGDGRTDLTSSVWPDACFNTHFLIAKHLSLIYSSMHLCNRILLGSRPMPGILASIKWSLNGDQLVWQRMMRIARIALTGFFAGRRAKAMVHRNRNRSTAEPRHLEPFGNKANS